MTTIQNVQGEFDDAGKLLGLMPATAWPRQSVPIGAPVSGAGNSFGGAMVVAASGDSITQASTDTTNKAVADSWLTHMVIASGGALIYGTNAGRGGFKSTDLLPLLDAEVMTTPGLGLACAAWGTNDLLTNGVPVDTMASDRAAVAKFVAAGVRFFLNTIPPQGVAAIATPAAPVCTPSPTGGTMTAGTYRYALVAFNGIGQTMIGAATTVVIASGTTNSVRVEWPRIPGSVRVDVYKDNNTGTLLRATGLTAGGGQSVAPKFWLDAGTTPAGAPPASNTTAAAVITASHQKITAINAWRRRYARQLGVPLADMYAVLTDPLTGMYKDGYTTDGVHPTAAAQALMGAEAWAAVSSSRPSVRSIAAPSQVDPSNILPNPLLVSASSGLPSGWSQYGGTAGSYTIATAARAGFLGNAFSVTRTTADGTRYYDSVATASVAAGDYLLLAFKLELADCDRTGSGWSVQLKQGGTRLVSVAVNECDFAPGVFSIIVQAPGAGPVFMSAFNLSFGSSGGVGYVGQICVQNLTALGLV